VVNPQVSSVTPSTLCGAGTQTLTATAATGTIKWYAAPTGGNSLFTGSSYTTPSISATKYYYVSLTTNDVIVTGCEGTRIADSAVVTNTNAVLTVAPNGLANGVAKTVCNATTFGISVTSTVADFVSYVWTPASNLYLDSALTTPYVAGSNATAVYVNRSTAGLVKYICTATTSNNCVKQDTAFVNIQPSAATISSTPTSICKSGTATMKLTPAVFPYCINFLLEKCVCNYF
jgi:hypothetical protein